ncbi:sodium/hydrogen exchanger 8 [Anaeramoeba flamelloides]|uniref:Sodium/hydrogen exchanger 8 n=1 Tax=Anaeramoeba flamelloides TaxID=1746091 RepID=A0ABQ8XTT9_9EUKA|nr:sodium/hydrogen exchanger 8 [Anaeramoeba flamelloides]
MGVITCLLLKHIKLKKIPILESTILFVFAWLSFVFTEQIGLSGIAAALFCGIVDAHYSFNNLSKRSKIMTKDCIHLISYISETFVFVYLGLATFTFTHFFRADVIIFSLIICLIGRAIHIFPLSALINHFRKEERKLPKRKQFIIFYSGLRGAVAFCLSLYLQTPEGHVIMTSTLAIIFFTVFIFGGSTKFFLKKFKLTNKIENNDSKKGNHIDMSDDNELEYDVDSHENEYLNQNEIEKNLHSNKLDDKSGDNFDNSVHKWILFDRKYIKPFLTRRKKMEKGVTIHNSSSNPERDLINQSEDSELLDIQESIPKNEKNDISRIENKTLQTNSDVDSIVSEIEK